MLATRPLLGTPNVDKVTRDQLVQSEPPTLSQERVLVRSPERATSLGGNGICRLDPATPSIDQPDQTDLTINLALDIGGDIKVPPVGAKPGPSTNHRPIELGHHLRERVPVPVATPVHNDLGIPLDTATPGLGQQVLVRSQGFLDSQGEGLLGGTRSPPRKIGNEVGFGLDEGGRPVHAATRTFAWVGRRKKPKPTSLASTWAMKLTVSPLLTERAPGTEPHKR